MGIDSKGSLRGVSFSIADLALIRVWSRLRGLRMSVRLDHGSETEEYEEVLAFYAEHGQRCRWIMWRDADAVFVQPLIGRTKCFSCVVEALYAQSARPTMVGSGATSAD